MGMTIDGKCYLYGSCKCQTAGCVVRPDNGCPVYRYFKDLIVKDYENRLKADMVAMLTEIQLEIREYHEIGCDEDCNNCRMVGCVEPVNVIKDLDIIQQKINALKENKNEKN